MENKNNDIQAVSSTDSQIVLYQPDETISLEVKLDTERETVWLTQQQIADLFGTKRPAITKHLSNIFKSGELDQDSVSSILEHTASDGKIYKTQFYNLDAIISVGYRVNSINATVFRRWATNVLRDYLLKGYSVNQQLLAMQRQIDTRFDEQSQRMLRIEDTQAKQQQQLDFFIRTSTPPAEMVFFNGQFFTARVAIEYLIKTAEQRVIIIDHYVDAKTFDMFDVRKPGVQGIIYTQGVGAGMTRLRDEHNRQTGVQPVEVFKWRTEPHDRFLIIDNRLYHCGHSLNATGGKLSAIMLMGTSPDVILAEM
jgi:hypothetical protein